MSNLWRLASTVALSARHLLVRCPNCGMVIMEIDLERLISLRKK